MNRLREIYQDYPQQFWLLMGATFIDMVGNALIFPFFALFLTDKFDISLTRVGVIFAIFSVTGMVGGTIGGALADRLGRKPIALTSLVVSALGNLCLVLITEFWMLYVLAATLGVIGSIGGPAWHAMLADLLPEKKRAEGFGLQRIAFNVAVIFGPMIGGLLAGVSYTLLFSVDAMTSIVTAAILLVYLKETRPQGRAAPDGGEPVPQETMWETFKGYRVALRDSVFITFALLGMVVWLVYFQMNTTLSVFLRDEHGIAPTGFGLLLALNASIVVALQLWITRRLRGLPSMLVLAAGTALYALGFGMYGFVSAVPFFVLAMVIITVGEMVVVPVGQAVATQLAPEDMRGRYMALFGFSHAIASGSGVWLAGQIVNLMGPEYIWIIGGIVLALATLGYARLHQRIGTQVDDALRAAGSAPESELAKAIPEPAR